MTCKTIALLRRREGLSHAGFVDYYETRHVPLIRALLPGIVDYRRNFVYRASMFASSDAAPVDFDVITELWWETRAAYAEAMVIATRADVAARIAADEANFLDRSGTRMFVVEERCTPVEDGVGAS